MSSQYKIALATCHDLPGFESDEFSFHRALADRGADLSHPVWDDPEEDWRGYDACLIRTTWDYSDHRGRFLEWVEKTAQVTRLYNPCELVCWNTEKSYLKQLEGQGVPLAPTRWFARGEQVNLAAVLEASGWEKALIKPLVGAAAKGTFRIKGPGDISGAQAHLNLMLQQESMMMQAYLESVETEGEWSAVFIDGQFSHGLRKIPKAGDYRVMDHFGATDQSVTFSDDQLQFCEGVWDATRALFPQSENPLYGRVDLLRSASGWVLNELELVEPFLFFRRSEVAADLLAEALFRRLGRLR